LLKIRIEALLGIIQKTSAKLIGRLIGT